MVGTNLYSFGAWIFKQLRYWDKKNQQNHSEYGAGFNVNMKGRST